MLAEERRFFEFIVHKLEVLELKVDKMSQDTDNLAAAVTSLQTAIQAETQAITTALAAPNGADTAAIQAAVTALNAMTSAVNTETGVISPVPASPAAAAAGSPGLVAAKS